MRKKAFSLPLLATAGAIFLNVVNVPASQAAFTVDMNGRSTRDGRAKVNMVFDSDEVGRRLDNSYFIQSARPDRGLNGDLEGRVSLTVAELTDSLLTFDVKVSDRTRPNLNAAIVSLWLGIAETVSDVEIVEEGQTFQRAQLISSVPGGGAGAGVCFSVSGCGGRDTAVNEGLANLSDSFRVNITGEFGAAGSGFGQVTLTDTGARWKNASRSYNVAGVPEPLTILGSGAALAFGAMMKRRLSKKQEA